MFMLHKSDMRGGDCDPDPRTMRSHGSAASFYGFTSVWN